ncbi:uncharacterized protein METZ01_LOCUS100906 [marine metagenome]|uniref:Uncharacterized protein n=1 Tax=marine metagenome TaxID=408172 RepID=A0A381W6E9_9ZZZZ
MSDSMPFNNFSTVEALNSPTFPHDTQTV